MSKLTTKEEIMNQPIGSTLFLINPFGYPDQSKVPIQEVVIQFITEEYIGSVSERSEESGRVYTCTNYYNDMLRRCKSVFTTTEEATAELELVHQGEHAETVQKHISNNSRIVREIPQS